MATASANTAAKRTALMNRLQSIKNSGTRLDTAKNESQVAWFTAPMSSQWWISNIQKWDVSFGNWSQMWQWSPYNMYPTGSYNTQFARYWDPLQTWNTAVDEASNNTIGQYAQYERALTPNISAYQDKAWALNQQYLDQAAADFKNYQRGNQNMQDQSNQYYQGVNDYLASEQWAQQAFAQNEAMRSTGSNQAAQSAGQRVWAQYVWLSNEARAQKYAEDKALFNELTNKTSEYLANIKWSRDQYELDVAKQLLDLRNQLASSLTQQQQVLVAWNMQYNLNDLAAQAALVRQQALNVQQAQLAKQYK